jgi:AraC-like DNA-binding protein
LRHKHPIHPLKGLKPALKGMAKLGFSSDTCLEGLNLTDIDNAESPINYTDEFRVYRRLLALSGDPALGLILGKEYSATTFGMFGYTLMSALSLRQALDISARFGDLTYSMFHITNGENSNNEPFIRLDTNFPLPDDLARIFIDRDISCTKELFTSLTNNTKVFTKIVFSYPRPTDTSCKHYEDYFNCDVEFNGLTNLVFFDPKFIDLPLSTGDELTLNICTQQCSDLLDNLSQVGRFSDDVRHLILTKPGEFPSMEKVALKMGMSERTLRRKLNNEGMNYQQLLNEIRLNLAKEYMRLPIKLEEVSSMLGYSDPSNFSHAFKRIYNLSPRQWLSKNKVSVQESEQ